MAQIKQQMSHISLTETAAQVGTIVLTVVTISAVICTVLLGKLWIAVRTA